LPGCRRITFGEPGVFYGKGIGMSLIKHILAQGMYYTSIGVRDYAEWSQMLIDEFGPGIEPSIRHIRKWSLMLPEIMNAGSESKINCWEFMGCGLHMNGDVKGSGEVALCPASLDQIRKGMHGGKMPAGLAGSCPAHSAAEPGRILPRRSVRPVSPAISTHWSSMRRIATK
jgi:hypothetical protein